MRAGRLPGYCLVSVVLGLLVALAGCAPAAQSTATAAPKAPAAAETKPAAQPTKAAAQQEAKPAGEAPKQLVTLGFGLIPHVATSPTYVALQEGYLKEQGIDLSIEGFPDTVQIMTLIATGKLQLGQVTMGAAAFNSFARKTDMVMIASANQDPAGPSLTCPLVIRKDLIDSGKVKTVADLKGMKVALNGKGTVLEWTLSAVLATGGLKYEDVDVPIMPWPDMVVALGNKAIDGGLIGEPAGTEAVMKGVGVKLTNYKLPAAQYGTIFANKIYAKQHPEVIRNFLVGYLKAIREMTNGKLRQNPKLLDVVQGFTKVPMDTLKEMPSLYWDPNGRVNKDSIVEVQKYLLDHKSVDYTEALPLSDVLDESYLEQALTVVGTVPK